VSNDINSKEWQLEQDRVNIVIEEIDRKAAKYLQNTGMVGSDVLELRKSFWEDVTVNLDEPDDVIETAASIKQQAELLSERERTKHQFDRQLKLLERLRFSPYFGRIDFFEEGEEAAETVYLGVASLMDEQDENFLIYDWRAPISSLYYDYPPGPAHYQTPEGIIRGEMTVKRQFIIRASKIKGMFDTGVTIGDEMLQEVLGNNASTQMKSIVATIQREQNAIIRNERSKYVMVQGVAGSGKTSAAMQRVAYLLYRYRGTLKSENIMLFSPNPLFNSYVATVLPELGEENMQQSTFQEYLYSRLGKEFDVEDPFDQMEYLLSSQNEPDYHTRINGIRFKASMEFKKMIDEFVDKLASHGMIFKGLSFKGNIIISQREIHQYFYSFDHDISIPNRLQLVKEKLLRELKHAVKRERSKSWVEDEIQYLDKEDYQEAFKQLQAKKGYTDKTFDDFEWEQRLLSEMILKKHFKPLFTSVKKLKFIDMPALYIGLFTDEIQNDQLPENWSAICQQTAGKVNNGYIPYEDATPYVYMQDLIKGRSSNTSIRHIFIDEAQDYTPIQFAFIQHLFPHSKMTMLGDFNQAIFSGETGSETVLTDLLLEGEEVETFRLKKTYRSTREIVEFTKKLVENGDEIEPFNRKGKIPTVTMVEKSELNKRVLEKVFQLQEQGYQTIAIICRTADESVQTYRSLRQNVELHLIEKGTITFEKGVVVIPSYLAKGIEFDAVILYDSSQYKQERERKLFYTVCTRAMHQLDLFATEGISPLMKNVSTEEYEIEE